jgi:SAM-dependent methyltransferase
MKSSGEKTDSQTRPQISNPFEFHNSPPDEKFQTPSWFKYYQPPSQGHLEYWNTQYRFAKEGKKHEVADWSMRHPANEFHQLMAKEFWNEVPKDFDTILDVGCNDGYMVKFFQDCGKKAVGINDVLNPVDWAYVEEHNLPVCEMDMHCMEFPAGLFDAVWCRHTIEHSFAPLQVLAEINRVLKPNGYFFAVLPPPPAPPRPYPGHWHQIPDYQFKYLLETCSFEVLRLWTAWFSYKRENDNVEIRSICRKRV